MTSIEALHTELGFGKIEGELKTTRPSVYRTLAAAQRRAKQDPSALPRYRKLLVQSIERFKAEKSDGPDVDEIVAAASLFWRFYDEQVVALNIAQHEAVRIPRNHQEWVETQLPKTWAKFTRAVAQTVETGSPRSFETLRQVAVDMLQAYIEGRE